MSTSQIKLYNEALRLCGERNLTSLTEARESRRLLDQVWDNDGVRACLEAGQWKFAMRSIEITYNPSIEPDFGYTRAFDKPTDLVRTCAVCSDEYFSQPLLRYNDEAGYWFSDLDTIYVRYVSDDSAYGGDYSLWPATFTKFVAAYFAAEIVTKLTSDEQKMKSILHPSNGLLAMRRTDALSKDAMQDPTRFMPEGTWAAARRGRWGGSRDGGNRGSLIG